MSSISTSELPLSDQIAIDLREADKLAARTRELFASVDLLVALSAPLGRRAGHPLSQDITSRSTPLSNVEAIA